MAADKKTGSTNDVTKVVHTLLDGLHSMSKSETIVGDPYTLGEATIVPVHRLRVALGAGSVHGGAKQDAARGESGGAGAGGAVQIEPVAVIAVDREGVPRILCVEQESDTAERLLKQLPDLIGNATKALSERIAPLVGRLVNRSGQGPAPLDAEASKAELAGAQQQPDALPDRAPALLASKREEQDT